MSAHNAETRAGSMQPMTDPYEAINTPKDPHERLRTMLDVQRVLGDLVMKHNPYTVLEGVRDWLDYMDRCVAITTAQSDGEVR